jgi:hypothetical protein
VTGSLRVTPEELWHPPLQHDQGVERQSALRQGNERVDVDGLHDVFELDGEPAERDQGIDERVGIECG